MLGNAAIGQFAIAQFPGGGAADTGLAWRRELAYLIPGAILNRDKPDEEELILMLAMLL